MKLLRHVLLATVAAITLATGAHAGGDVYERRTWAEPGRGWVVDYTPETNSCSLSRRHTNGVSLQIFYVPETRAFVLMLLNEKWSKIEDNASYRLRLEMDGGADLWKGDARGIWTNDGYPGLVVGSLSYEFIKSFMKRNRVDLYNTTNGNWITALLLDGSAAAMVGLIECLDAHNSGNGNNAPAPKQRRPEFQM